MSWANGALAWGPDGHSIVAELAQRRLTPKAQSSIAALLGSGVSLASISSWADDYKFVFGGEKTRRWHFVDIDIAQDGGGTPANCEKQAEGDCITAALTREVNVLTDASASMSARESALKFVVHLIGDIHQPLHCAERNNDGGGNGLAVTFQGKGPDGKPLNDEISFHKLWDETLIEAHTFSWGAYADELETSVMPGLSPDTRLDHISNWTEECHKAGQQAYALLPTPVDGSSRLVIDQTYQQRVQPLLDRELTLAALRLAAVLNQILDR
nr:S1/P1 nuclease [Phyllobacterium sp. KW56]